MVGAAAPGWYPDPQAGPVAERYWDGAAWSPQTRPSGWVGPQPGYASPYGWAPVRPTNDLAVASLICSIGTVVTGFTWIIGVVLGHIALHQIRRSDEGGRGLAVAGLIIGYSLAVLEIATIVAVVALIRSIHTTTLVPHGQTLNTLQVLGGLLR